LDLAELALELDEDRRQTILSSILDSLEPVREAPAPKYWQMAASYKLLYGSRTVSGKKDAPQPRWDYGFMAREAGYLRCHPASALGDDKVLSVAKEVWDRLLEYLDGLSLSSSEVYALAHSHLDVAWLWPFTSTRYKALRTFANMVSVIRRVGVITGGLDSPQNFRLVEEAGLIGRIKEEVDRGRLILLGGMWIEPDTWTPSGETLARELLHGQKYYEERFGRRARIAMLLDTFGLSPQLPQLLAGSGLEVVITHKMMWNDTTRFPLRSFAWIGIDGSTVPAHVAVTYDGGATLRDLARNLEMHGRASKTPLIYLYSYGDGGGGPSILMGLRMKRIWESGLLPRLHVAMTESDLVSRLKAVEGSWWGEIYNEYHRGVYTADSRVKSLFSALESCLLKLDYWVSMQWLTGLGSDTGKMAAKSRELWEVLIRSAFHDIVTGSSSREASEYSQRELKRALEACRGELRAALSLIAGYIDSPAGSIAFNPLGWGIELGGQMIPMHGYKALQGGPIVDAGREQPIEKRSGFWVLSSGKLRVEVDGHGLIRSIAYGGVELLSGPSNRVMVHANRPGEFDAWEIDYDSIRRGSSLGFAYEEGQAGGQLGFRGSFRDSIIGLYYSIRRVRRDKPVLEVVYSLEWYDEGYLVKSWFHLPPSHSALFEIPFGFVWRGIGENNFHNMGRFELPYTRWFYYPINGGPGLGFISTARHGVSAARGLVGLSIHMSPVFPNPVSGIGEFKYTYLIAPVESHENPPLAMARLAREEHVGYDIVEKKTGKGGELPESTSFIRQEGEAIIESIKPSWTLDGVIVRIYDPTGKGSSISLSLPSRVNVYKSNIVEDKLELLKSKTDRISLDLSPFEIKTIYMERA
ncbi:MAG: glycosyl hydrolase-related protein, partial [Desulfurococcales archaeon]|nr:glycosyl hydrolase-related protein [Desulfurococcales archaeon]